MDQLLSKYPELNLANKIDPQTRQTSIFQISILPTDEDALQMLQVLLKHGADPYFLDQLKQSVIFYLAREGKMKCVEFLAEKNCDIDIRDQVEQTPLFYAAVRNRLDMVKLFHKKGANLLQQDHIK